MIEDIDFWLEFQILSVGVRISNRKYPMFGLCQDVDIKFMS